MKHLVIILMLLSCFSFLLADRASGYDTYGPLRINTIKSPTFSIPGGYYDAPISISLSATAGANARIRYTLDGTEPSMNSGILYNGPIVLANTTTIKAVTYIQGVEGSLSHAVSETYSTIPAAVEPLCFDIVYIDDTSPRASYYILELSSGSTIPQSVINDHTIAVSNTFLLSTLNNRKSIKKVKLLDINYLVIGHIDLDYSYEDLVNNVSIQAILSVFGVHTPFESETGAWSYYSEPNERMVSMLVKPNSIDNTKAPLMLVHGIGGSYPAFGRQYIKQLNGNPNTTIDDVYDIWEYYYPYDQQIELSADLLSSAIQMVRANYPTGSSSLQRVCIAAHSMGGLVTRSYIQSFPGEDTGIRKFVMLGTPNHGSHSSFRISNHSYYPVSSYMNKVSVNQDTNSPAIRQLYPGSSFLKELNSVAPRPLYPGASLQNTYLVVAGTKNEFRSLPAAISAWEHFNPSANDDIVVSLASASLLEWGIPLATKQVNHLGLVGVKPVDIPLVFTVMNPGFLMNFFSESYSTNGNPFGSAVENFWTQTPAIPCESSNIQISFNKSLDSRLIKVNKVWFSNTLKMKFDDEDAIESTMEEIDERTLLYYSNRLRLCENNDDHSYYFMEQKTWHLWPYPMVPYPKFGLTGNMDFGTYSLRLVNHRGRTVKNMQNALNISNLATTNLQIDLSDPEMDLLRLSNVNSPIQRVRTRDENDRSVIEEIYYIDTTINTAVFYLGEDEDVPILADHNSYIIDPEDNIIDPSVASSLQSVTFEEDITSGFAYYHVSNPLPGVWRFVFNDELPDDISSVIVDSPVDVSIELNEQEVFVGDVVEFSLPLPMSDNYSAPTFNVILSFLDSEDEETSLSNIAVTLNPQGTAYTGSFVAETVGTYKLTVFFQCEMETQVVHRQIEKRVLVQGIMQPQLANPPNNSASLPTSLLFDWHPVSSATSYYFELFVLDQESPSISATINDTLYVVSGLDNSTSYYWHVCAVNDSSVSLFTAPYYFNTIISDPELVHPTNQAVDVSPSVTLIWDAVTYATQYGLQLSSYEDFSACWVETYAINSSQYQLNGLNPNQTYYWRVCAINEHGPGSWSELWSFTVRNSVIQFPAEIQVQENHESILYLQNHIDDYSPTIYEVIVENNINLDISILSDRIVINPQDQWHGIEDIVLKVMQGAGRTSAHQVGTRSSLREQSIVYQDTISIVVIEVNDLPELSMSESLMFWYCEDKTIDLSPYLSDVDNDLDEIYVNGISSANISVELDGHHLSLMTQENWFGSEVIEIQLSNSAPRYDNRRSSMDSKTRTALESNSYYILISIVDATPNIKSHALSGNEVTLTWDSILGADSYRIYSSSTPDGIFTDVTATGNLNQTNNQLIWHKALTEAREFFYLKAVKGERSLISKPITPQSTMNRKGN